MITLNALLTPILMTHYKTLNYVVADRIAIITLNRPNDANGMNLALTTELAQVAKTCSEDGDVKAVILTGSGKFFCAGGDVKAMHEGERSAGDTVKQIADQLHLAISIFSRMSAPLISAVNGVAAGAGFSIALSADMVIASENAKFTMAYSKIGLSPDGSSSYFLPRLIGMRKTQELMFTNRVLSAEEALQWGLINQVVADDQLVTQATALAQTFVKGSLTANAAIKQLLVNSFVNDLETQMNLESDTIKACANASDGQEGVASFVEKRAPRFN